MCDIRIPFVFVSFLFLSVQFYFGTKYFFLSYNVHNIRKVNAMKYNYNRVDCSCSKSDISAESNIDIVVIQNIIGQVEVRLPMSDLCLKKLTASPAWGEVRHILEEYQKSDIHLYHQGNQVQSETGRCKNCPKISAHGIRGKLYRLLSEFFCKGN